MKWLRESIELILSLIGAVGAAIYLVFMWGDDLGWIRAFGISFMIFTVFLDLLLGLMLRGYLSRFILRIQEQLQTIGAPWSSETSQQRAKEAPISVTYLNQVRERDVRARTILMISTVVLLVLTYAFDVAAISNAIFVPLVLYLLLLLRDVVLQYRITHGLFGSNEYEAHALIEFLLENADKTDFTDGTGKLKPIFLPENLRVDSAPAKEGVGVRT